MIAFNVILYRTNQHEARDLLEKYQQAPNTAIESEVVA
jgi:hypothetical protein